MKHFWSNNKDKLVITEEGKIGEHLEPFPKNGACKKFLQVVQFILVLEVVFFLGWISYSFYQSKYNPFTDHEENSEMNSLSGGRFNHHHEDSKLNLESSDDLKWPKESSSEPWSKKTQVFENPDSSTESDPVLLNSVKHPELSSSEATIPDNIELAILLPTFPTELPDSNIELMTTNNYEDSIIESSTLTNVGETVENEDKSEANQQISTDDVPSSGVFFQRYHFQISLGSKTEPEEKENSLATSEEKEPGPFFFHVFFNVSDPEKTASSENSKSIIDPVSEVDPDFSWKLEVPIPQEEKAVRWWVNTPEFQDTRGEFQSNEESQAQDDVVNSFDNEMASLETNILNQVFDEPDSKSAIIFESRVINPESTDVSKNDSENLDTILSDFLSTFMSSEDDNNSISKSFDDSTTSEDPSSNELTSLKSSTETLEKKIMDMLIQSISAEEKQTDDPEQNGSTELKHDFPEVLTPPDEDKDSAWTDEEKWLLSKPTWKVTEESEDFLKDLPKISHTYEYEDSADSAEYNYD